MIEGLTREELNALRCKFPQIDDEAEHFYVCEGCGQAVDMSGLGTCFIMKRKGMSGCPCNDGPLAGSGPQQLS